MTENSTLPSFLEIAQEDIANAEDLDAEILHETLAHLKSNPLVSSDYTLSALLFIAQTHLSKVRSALVSAQEAIECARTAWADSQGEAAA